MIKLKNSRAGRVSSGHVPRAHACSLLIPSAPPKSAYLIELHKLNVPCAKGGIKYSQNTTELCGKLEQISMDNRKYYTENSDAVIQIRGRPTFAVTFRIVDYCHEVFLIERNGSFVVGPTEKIWCSFTIHLPYGNKVAIRLEIATGPLSNSNSLSVIKEDSDDINCKGIALTLEDGDSVWKHCSKPGDPLRNVQIVSEENLLRLNISIMRKRESDMWVKLWWMDKPIDEVIGKCEYGWVAAGGFCIAAHRERKSWIQAENDCKQKGGHLASILSDRQQRVVDQLLIHT